MMVPALIIQQYLIQHQPLRYFDCSNTKGELRTEVWKNLKKATGYRYDNNKTFWSDIFGNLCSIAICSEKSMVIPPETKSIPIWTVTLWDTVGSTFLDSKAWPVEDLKNDRLPNEVYKWMEEVSENFHIHGLKPCSNPKCRKPVDYKKYSNQRIFAALYCPECWESKYKAEEAKTSYD